MLRLLTFVLVIAGCAGDKASSMPPDASHGVDSGMVAADAPAVTACDEATQHADLAWIQDHVFTPSCATGMCHRGSDPVVGLSLEAGMSHATLVNHDASTQSGWIRVVPGSPATSYLMVALGRAAGPAPKDGTMPLGMPALCAQKVDAVARWILAGAPE